MIDDAPLPRPSAARLLEGVLTLGREIHLGMDERQLCDRFLGTLADLFPDRRITIRLFDKNRSAARRSETGFAIPLAAGGEVYGVLEVARPDPEDEAVMIPIANQLAVALRNVRLHAETRVLRDTVAKLIDQADALIFSIDREFRITVYNRSLTRLTGKESGSVLGRDVRELLPVGQAERLGAVLEHLFAGGVMRPIDVEFPDSSGRAVRTVWNVAGVGEPGNVEAVVAVGQDLTRIKSLEMQVVQAEKLATLGQLAAGVGHELGNPLTSIIACADYLVKKLAPRIEAGDLEKLRRILEGAERISAFARTLVQYARPSGEQAEKVQLNDVVRQALFLCEHVTRGARVEVALAEGLPPIRGLRAQLVQVVINLVTNAVQALPGESGRIHVATFAAGASGAAIAVEDSGPGVPTEDKERIFEPFFTTKPDGKGSGLGLSIVKDIVDRHRGSVELDSQPGRGSRFTVLLPGDGSAISTPRT